LADNTYAVLSFQVSGTGSVTFFVNGRQVAQHITNIPDDENLAVAAMSLSGSASGTRATTLDYLIAAQTR
jgi:O-acetylhomoserine/O-acetylserine sulfhydrylase-like pyridoxal-dependent enzyme